ncbi:hypothetical protein RRF57_011836 [Xylaria bambusicola]|uniref:Uncharacterized protein n=1 Tax=Xylaria bambusicola TaxID=326684 RepID=A0AAN7Z422_9PEZI
MPRSLDHISTTWQQVGIYFLTAVIGDPKRQQHLTSFLPDAGFVFRKETRSILGFRQLISSE